MCSTRNCVQGIGVVLIVATSCAAGEWHHPLYRDGGGIWRQRMPIMVTNTTDQALRGYPVTLAVGDGASPLAGMPAESIRVCDASGQEMLFAITDTQGLLLTRGPIPSHRFTDHPCRVQAPPVRHVLCVFREFLRRRAGRLPGGPNGPGQPRPRAMASTAVAGSRRAAGAQRGGGSSALARDRSSIGRKSRSSTSTREPVSQSQACLDLSMLQARARGHVDLSSLRLTLNGESVPALASRRPASLPGERPGANGADGLSRLFPRLWRQACRAASSGRPSTPGSTWCAIPDSRREPELRSPG